MRRRPYGSELREQLLGYVAAVFASASPRDIHELLGELEPPPPYRIRLKVLYAAPESVRTALVAGLSHTGRVRPLRQDPTAFGFAFRVTRPARRGRFAGAFGEEAGDDWDDGAAGVEEVRDVPVGRVGAGSRSTARANQDGGADVYFAVLPTAAPNVSAVVAVAEREDWTVFLREVRRLYPDVVPIYLSQRELLDGIATLRERVAGRFELRVRELSAKEIIDTPEGRQTRSMREWTQEAWERALRDVSARRQVVTSVTLAFHRLVSGRPDVTPAAMCKVTKRGEVEVTGRFGLLWDTVVAAIAAAGQAKLSHYSKRGLRENAYHARPLTITYPAPVFGDVVEIRRLVAALERYPKSMHAVQHGNPYAYVQVADAYDGSAFDVWAVDDDRITVVPRLKATEAAVDRLIQYIFDAFREGTVDADDA